jgi:hypothetical protein
LASPGRPRPMSPSIRCCTDRCVFLPREKTSQRLHPDGSHGGSAAYVSPAREKGRGTRSKAWRLPSSARITARHDVCQGCDINDEGRDPSIDPRLPNEWPTRSPTDLGAGGRCGAFVKGRTRSLASASLFGTSLLACWCVLATFFDIRLSRSVSPQHLLNAFDRHSTPGTLSPSNRQATHAPPILRPVL